MRHPEDVPLSLMIRRPKCGKRIVTDTDGVTYEWLCDAFEARVHGLVAGVDYIVGMNLNDGSHDIFQDEWVLEDALFLCTIPPLPLAVRSVRVSIFDGFKGLSRDESMLTTTVQDVQMSRAQSGDRDRKREFSTCFASLIYPSPKRVLATEDETSFTIMIPLRH